VLKHIDKLQEVAKASSGVQKTLSTWAKSEAAAYWASYDFDALKEFSFTRTVPVTYYLAKTLLSVAHKKLGFDRCYAFYVSAAPIEVKILQYFASLNIPIMELFGQSECTGPHSVNRYDAFKIGTVGRPMIGTETKLDAQTGELCYRGRHIFAGYKDMCDKTNETIDADGWLHSGDVVTIDDNHDPSIPQPSGFISITGRIKELIITAGGENVPPVLIEDHLKTAMPALSNAMVIGDKRKFLSVVLCLQVDIDANGLATNKLIGRALDTAKEIGSAATTADEARDDPKWQAYFDEGVKKANASAASRAQQVGKWSLLSTDFTELGGELTPTLKLKRSVAAEKHAVVIEAMYA
jgi:long-chain-fatty-acid--CoA ligase ACSBG